MKKPRVMWIEDAALADLSELTGPVHTDGTADLSIAMSATEGLQRLLDDEFQCVVFDIRLPPGEDRRWINLYNQSGHDKGTAQLGLWLAESCLSPSDARVRLEVVPQWIAPSRVGFLSVEPWEDVSNVIDRLCVGVYRQKSIDDEEALLNVIKSVLKN